MCYLRDLGDLNTQQSVVTEEDLEPQGSVEYTITFKVHEFYVDNWSFLSLTLNQKLTVSIFVITTWPLSTTFEPNLQQLDKRTGKNKGKESTYAWDTNQENRVEDHGHQEDAEDTKTVYVNTVLDFGPHVHLHCGQPCLLWSRASLQVRGACLKRTRCTWGLPKMTRMYPGPREQDNFFTVRPGNQKPWWQHQTTTRREF